MPVLSMTCPESPFLFKWVQVNSYFTFYWISGLMLISLIHLGFYFIQVYSYNSIFIFFLFVSLSLAWLNLFLNIFEAIVKDSLPVFSWVLCVLYSTILLKLAAVAVLWLSFCGHLHIKCHLQIKILSASFFPSYILLKSFSCLIALDKTSSYE